MKRKILGAVLAAMMVMSIGAVSVSAEELPFLECETSTEIMSDGYQYSETQSGKRARGNEWGVMWDILKTLLYQLPKPKDPLLESLK